MKADSLKPFGDSKYLSEEDALKLIEKIPIPKDDSGSANSGKAKPGVPKANSPSQDSNPVVDLEGRIVVLNPPDNGNSKTQDEWIDYFNERKEIMVSMADIYLAVKSGNQDMMDSLKRDFHTSGLITSTRIIYEDRDNARIIHYYGGNVIKPLEYAVFIREYGRTELTDILASKEGCEYLQALFGTKDDAGKIKDTLYNLCDYPSDKINISIAVSRDISNCVVSFIYYTEGEFNFGNGSHFCRGGSRGMRIGTAPVTQTTGGAK
jgi:hypothetical protein